MKRYLYMTMVALAGLFASACDNSEKPLEEADHYIEVVSESAFQVGYEEEIINVEIDANCKWNISKTDSNGEGISWIKTDATAGTGPKAFRIKVLKNKTEFERRGSVNIYSDQVTAHIDITQEANPDPYKEPVPFVGYTMPVYQMFESGLGIDVAGGEVKEMDCDFTNATVEGNVITFTNGLVIEKTGTAPADFKMACPVHTKPATYAGFQLGVGATFAEGDSWIYKIPMNFALSGDLRFTYGSRKEDISDASAYQWSSDGGKTWNDVTKMESIKSEGAFKSVWFTIPEAQRVEAEGSLWIKVTPAATKVYIQNGIALEKASASLSSVAPQDNSTIVISEGFDDIADANASYITVPGFMKSAVTGYSAKGSDDTNPYVSTNPAVSYTHCFARPGFLQVGYSNEAQVARCGFNGSVTLDVGKRLAEMGIADKVGLKVSLKAAGMTNAYGRSCDAQLVLKSAETVVASIPQLSMDRFAAYTLTVPEADQNTVLEITSLPCDKPGDGTATSAYEAADYRFFIDDLVVEVIPVMTDRVLTFDFTAAAAATQTDPNWPTGQRKASNGDDISDVECNYNLDGVDYSFLCADCPDKTASKTYWNKEKGYIVIGGIYRYLGLPVLEGYKLVKVVCLHGTSAAEEGRGLAVTSEITESTVTPNYVSGGEPQVTKTTGDTLTYDLEQTSTGVRYYLNCTLKTIGLSKITLTYTVK